MKSIQEFTTTIDVEGTPRAWSSETATAEEIKVLAGWPPDVELVLDGEPEREIQPSERFDLQHKPRFKRFVVHIRVNHQPVRMHRRVATGHQVKEAAVAQGVAIRLDFVLFLVTGEELRPVADEKPVHLHQHQEFRCVAGDDNS